MTHDDCERLYGKIDGEKWPLESSHCTVVNIPSEISERVINSATGKPWTHVYCNRDMAAPLLRALAKVVARGLLSELETFDGCLMIRAIRGISDQASAHSWAMAIDLNAHLNPLGAEPRWSPEFVACFAEEGFTYGGNFSRKDGMHFSKAGF